MQSLRTIVIALSLGGITLSVTTMVAAWRRLQRHTRRWRAVVLAPHGNHPRLRPAEHFRESRARSGDR